MVFDKEKADKLAKIFERFVAELGTFQQRDLTKEDQQDPTFNFTFNRLIIKFLEHGVGRNGLLYHLIGLTKMASDEIYKDNLMDIYFDNRLDEARDKADKKLKK